MRKLNDVSVSELRDLLQEVEGKTPTMRLVVAINYKRGASPKEIANTYGVELRTVYNWIQRFEERPLDQAPYDSKSPGRHPKLSGSKKKA